MASNVSLSTLISNVQLRADNHRLTSAQLTTFVNQAGAQLFDKLVGAFGEDYELKQVQFKTAASVTTYPLSYLASMTTNSGTFTQGLTVTGGSSGATGVIRSVLTVGAKTVLDISDLSWTVNTAGQGFTNGETLTDTSSGSGVLGSSNGGLGTGDFYQMRGLDVQVNGQFWAPLKQYNWKDRDTYQSAVLYLGIAGPYYRYRVQGNNLILQPTPTGGNLIQFSYTPTFHPLVNMTDVIDGVNGFEEWVVLRAAQMCLINEEQDDSPIARLLTEQNDRIVRMSAARNTGEPKMVAAMSRSYEVGPFMGGLMMPPGDWGDL